MKLSENARTAIEPGKDIRTPELSEEVQPSPPIQAMGNKSIPNNEVHIGNVEDEVDKSSKIAGTDNENIASVLRSIFNPMGPWGTNVMVIKQMQQVLKHWLVHKIPHISMLVDSDEHFAGNGVTPGSRRRGRARKQTSKQTCTMAAELQTDGDEAAITWGVGKMVRMQCGNEEGVVSFLRRSNRRV